MATSPGSPRGSTAGRTRGFRWPRRSRWRDGRNAPHVVKRRNTLRYCALHRLLDCARERKQTPLDEAGHLANIIDGLAAILENARRPGNLVGQFHDLGLIALGRVLQASQLERVGSYLAGDRLLLARDALDAGHHLGALAVERL